VKVARDIHADELLKIVGIKWKTEMHKGKIRISDRIG